MALFETDFLRRLEYYSVVARRSQVGQLMAQRSTRRLGAGIEFADHREYHPGDDFRHLDWNLFARHDDLMLKRFREEQDQQVEILVDCSRSMTIGSPPKFDRARQLAAVVAYIALAGFDQVSVTAFAGSLHEHFPLARGRAVILPLLQFLEGLSAAQSETHLEDCVSAVVHRNQRRGIVVLISDCFDPRGFERAFDLLRHHRRDTHVIQLMAPEDVSPDLLGDVEVVDAETGRTKRLTVTRQQARRYRERVEQFATDLQGYCRRHGFSHVSLPSDVTLDQSVLLLLKRAGTIE